MADIQFAIVADIGGTNARFSRVDLDSLHLDKVAVYPCADFDTLADALQFYRVEQGLTAIRHVALAIACPVTGDFVKMTNFRWQFSVSGMKADLDLAEFIVLNDFTAVAMSLPALKQTELVQIGEGHADQFKPMAVLGAGTGLGVAHLIPTALGYLPLPGEGGHVDFTAQTEQEWFIQKFLANKYGHVSPERLLSGPGLEDLYLAIAAFNNKVVEPLTASKIAGKALDGSCVLCKAVIEQFFASLGGLAGDLALTLSTFGGVFVAGGITPKLLSLINQSEFRTRFEAKGRFKDFNRRIATFVVTAEQPGLTGCAVYLKQHMAS